MHINNFKNNTRQHKPSYLKAIRFTNRKQKSKWKKQNFIRELLIVSFISFAFFVLLWFVPKPVFNIEIYDYENQSEPQTSYAVKSKKVYIPKEYSEQAWKQILIEKAHILIENGNCEAGELYMTNASLIQ